jgi:hypothetical protein
MNSSDSTALEAGTAVLLVSLVAGFTVQSTEFCERRLTSSDLLCGLVVRVLGYRSGGPGSIPDTTRKNKLLGLERGPLSLVSITEEVFDRKVAAPV